MKWNIDPRNPGEVFACAGLAHLAWRANPEAKTGFDLNERVRFVTPDSLGVARVPWEMHCLKRHEGWTPFCRP